MKNAAHQYEDKLLEFAYGELPQHEADAVDAHVRGCARCSQSLSEIRSVRTAMATLPMEAPSDAGLDSLMAYAEQAAKRNAQSAAPVPFWKKYLTPLMAVMTVVTVGVVGVQASKEIDSSPAAAAADRTLSAREETRSKNAEQAPLAKAEPVDGVQAPAPVVAAAPMPKAEAEADARKVNDELGFEGKRAAFKGTIEPSKKPAPQSVTRRSQSANVVSPNEVAELRQQNYSDVGLRGGKLARADDAKEAKALKEFAAPAPVQDKSGSSGFGLSGGSLGNSLDTATPGTGGLIDAPKDANKAPVAQKPSAPPPPREEATPAPSSYGPPKSKKSISLGGYGRGASLGDSSDDSVALEKSDSLGIDRDAKLAERQLATSRARTLESARVASNRGDRTSEIKYATEVLNSGATGSERVEALKRLCDAYENLGEAERADPFCDALVREFPNSVAAKAVAERRNQVQRASPAPRRKQAAEKEAYDADMEKPAKVEPAEAPAY